MASDVLSERIAIVPGSIVVVRDATWIVISVEETQGGRLVRVQGLSELVRDTTAAFYDSLDEIVPLDPSDATVKADVSPGFRRAKLWLEATIRKTPVPLADPELTVSTQMLVDTLGYQKSAVRKALDPANLRPRILLADAVGLGKTIEIGMILSELVRRGRGERILVVTPKHVLEQMQFELWTRFALPFVRLDSVGIQRVRQKLPATRNPFSLYKRAIISIDTLKQDKYRAHLARHQWDAVVIDESHNLTGATQNNALARLLAPNTEALILASATPHNGKKESFAELIRLLEPTAVTPSGDVIDSEAQRLIVRRHRHSPEVAREVGAQWAERLPPQNLLVPASPAEDAIAAELSAVWLHPQTSSPYSGDNKGLFPWTLAKSFLSSAAALRETVRERMKRLGPVPTIAQQRELDALKRLLALADGALAAPSAKYTALLDYLRGIGIAAGSSERVVIFSERVPTLKWLSAQLQNDLKLKPDQVEILHGGLTDVEQQRIVESFKKSSSKIRVLITGDIASEGVNLHSQCHELVHYDIPWSLIRIEQRNGRIDRYGQTKRPQITTLLLSPSDERFSGDVRVITRLVEREREAHTALGDTASLMGKYDADAEEQAIAQVLARGTDFDEVVPTVAQALTGGDTVAALLARIAGGGQDAPAGPAVISVDPSSGLFAEPVAFLSEALHEVYVTPAAAPGQSAGEGGVEWRSHPEHGTVSLIPPRDLRARLEVLPQSYLQERKVAKGLTLATTESRANALLADAREDKTSSSLWPEAHFLGPLHPTLEWAGDRALARLGRNEIFAMRGDVAVPTLLLVGTLTNRRGQIVAASFMTAEFPSLTALHPFVTPHGSAREAISVLGISSPLVNRQTPVNTDALTALVRPAVTAAHSVLDGIADSAAATVEERVDAWSSRINDWDEEAAAMSQIHGLRQRRDTVDRERAIADSMKPDQRLVRPLTVVLPAEEN
ncbi:helicase-related protein [Microbacterium luticocti]|uniref:helicase-related protein n=1 Tax=Microbacterium luticocti TaxID=451764 RepID=UPI00042403B7|nr:helicase-related protein [Microbacterium luticocti]